VKLLELTVRYHAYQNMTSDVSVAMVLLIMLSVASYMLYVSLSLVASNFKEPLTFQLS